MARSTSEEFGRAIRPFSHVYASAFSLCVSGYAFVGDDIGGYSGNPSPDLFTRWMELGAFNPLYRNHSAKGTADKEPWVHGAEHEAIRKRYIETVRSDNQQ